MAQMFFQIKRIMQVAIMGIISKKERYNPRTPKITQETFEKVTVTYDIDPIIKKSVERYNTNKEYFKRKSDVKLRIIYDEKSGM